MSNNLYPVLNKKIYDFVYWFNKSDGQRFYAAQLYRDLVSFLDGIGITGVMDGNTFVNYKLWIEQIYNVCCRMDLEFHFKAEYPEYHTYHHHREAIFWNLKRLQHYVALIKPNTSKTMADSIQTSIGIMAEQAVAHSGVCVSIAHYLDDDMIHEDAIYMVHWSSFADAFVGAKDYEDVVCGIVYGADRGEKREKADLSA